MLTAAAALLTTLAAEAQNPYLPLWDFIPDGEPYVFDDPDNPGQQRVYIYGSHDNSKIMYCGRDLVVWSAPVSDPAKWRCDGIIFESKKDRDGQWLYPDSIGDVLYAPDIATRREADGRTAYYLYPNNQAWGREGMIAKSYRPDGPFVVCNWSKDNPKETIGVQRFDPAAFVDDDGRAYAYWGINHSYAAELDTATMCTPRPGTKIIENFIPGWAEDSTFRFFEASSIRKIKDKYVYIYSRITRLGEWGLHKTNYTLAYAYANNPLGPYTYGGTIIDGRGKEPNPDGTMRATATYYGNTHGSIAKLGDQWYVFYHRQADTTEYSRQAMVAPITVDVQEGPNGKVTISEAEYTSEGFALDGLDPLRNYPAGIACYYTNPVAMYQQYPSMIYPGSHTRIYRDQYHGEGDPYDLAVNRCPMVNNTAGSVVGYKYFNLNKTHGLRSLRLNMDILPEGTDGIVSVFLDSPDTRKGRRIGSFAVSKAEPQVERTVSLDCKALTKLTGKHSLFLVFESAESGKSLCEVRTIGFSE